MHSTFIKKSTLKLFMLIYVLSIPLCIIERSVNIKTLPFDIPIMEISASFTPLTAIYIFVRKAEGSNTLKKLLERIFDFSGTTHIMRKVMAEIFKPSLA